MTKGGKIKMDQNPIYSLEQIPEELCELSDSAFDRHSKDFDRLIETLMKEKSSEKGYDALKKMYMHLKDITKDFYLDDEGIYLPSYDRMIMSVWTKEHIIPADYIIDIPKIDFSKAPIYPKDPQDHEAILNYLVKMTRDFLYGRLRQLYGNMPFEKYDLTNRCNDAAIYTDTLASSLHISCKYKVLNPGFTLDGEHGINHAFTFIGLDEKIYIVDCTYSQFFHRKRTLYERMGVAGIYNTPGAFMMLTPTRRKVAEKLLKDGWIECTDEVMKAYFDGFAICFRNGLFYEDTKDFTYETPYTADDYKRFLSYDDDQTNHEPIEHLGLQKRPLKYPRMKFYPKVK